MAHLVVDPFVDAEGRPRVVRGVGIQCNAPRVAELAGMLGFETVWIDVEHGSTLPHLPSVEKGSVGFCHQ